MINIKKSLTALGIKTINHGTSTGRQTFGGGKEISSAIGPRVAAGRKDHLSTGGTDGSYQFARLWKV